MKNLLLPDFIHIMWTWFYSFIWSLSSLSIIIIIIIEKSQIRLSCITSQRWLQNHAYIKPACITYHRVWFYSNRSVKQWWNSTELGPLAKLEWHSHMKLLPDKHAGAGGFYWLQSWKKSLKITWKQPSCPLEMWLLNNSCTVQWLWFFFFFTVSFSLEFAPVWAHMDNIVMG